MLMLAQSFGREAGILIRGAEDIVAWLCAASAFFALGHTFRHGELVRVGLWLDMLGTRGRWLAELFSLGVTAIFVAYMLWAIARFVHDSWLFKEVAQGLIPLPMFVWMGEILYRTRLSDEMFEGLSPWLGWLPGRLMHVNILGCAIFGTVSGSSAATCATIAKVALPELKRRGYDEKTCLGSLAAAGTLGILLPPSIIMVVYAVAAEVSIIKVFLAGFIPGFLLTALFSGYIIVWALLNPGKTPKDDIKISFLEK